MVNRLTYHGLLSILTLLSLFIAGEAQEIRVAARADSNAILVGDFLRIQIELERPTSIQVEWPAIHDTLGVLEVVRTSEISKGKRDATVIEHCAIIITSFEAGTHYFPSLQFSYIAPTDSVVRTAKTNPILITVSGVSVDTTQDIKDIKPPLAVSISFAEVRPYLIGVVIVGGLAWLGYLIYRKRRHGEQIFGPPPPPRPAHEIALDALRALSAEHLWQRGKVKEYHSSLTEIIRSYIEGKFAVPALELTSDEVLSHPLIQRLDNGFLSSLRTLLVRADFVKFAKYIPEPAENEESLTLAYSFVEATTSPVKESAATVEQTA